MIIYAVTIWIYATKRKSLPPSKGFSLGIWEVPVLVLASVWIIFELAIFRDASFALPWLYVLAMFALGALYLAFVLLFKGASPLKMPDLSSVDAILDGEGDAAA